MSFGQSLELITITLYLLDHHCVKDGNDPPLEQKKHLVHVRHHSPRVAKLVLVVQVKVEQLIVPRVILP